MLIDAVRKDQIPQNNKIQGGFMRWLIALGVFWALSAIAIVIKAFSLPTYRQINRQQLYVQLLEEAYNNHPFPDYLERLNRERAKLQRMEQMGIRK